MSRSQRRFEELYAAHGREAVHVGYLLTGSKEQGEDLAQEAFVRLLGRYGELRNRDAFRAYLLRTVVNLANSQFRRKAIERRWIESQKAPTSMPPPDIGERDALWAALATLPARQRAAVVLRFCEDLSEHQTAEILQTTPKAVRSLVTRGLEKLRKQEEVGV